MAKPINRFEIQVVYDGGALYRITSRRDLPLTRADVIAALKRYATELERAEARTQASVVLAGTQPGGSEG